MEDIIELIKFNEEVYNKYKKSNKDFEKQFAKKVRENIIGLSTKTSTLLIDNKFIAYFIEIIKKYAEGL